MHQDRGQDAARGAIGSSPPPPPLTVGTKVVVRNRFEGEWTGGFEVAGIVPHGYLLRRLSDGHAFPDVFTPAEVRQERRSEPARSVAGSHLDRRRPGPA